MDENIYYITAHKVNMQQLVDHFTQSNFPRLNTTDCLSDINCLSSEYHTIQYKDKSPILQIQQDSLTLSYVQKQHLIKKSLSLHNSKA